MPSPSSRTLRWPSRSLPHTVTCTGRPAPYFMAFETRLVITTSSCRRSQLPTTGPAVRTSQEQPAQEKSSDRRVTASWVSSRRSTGSSSRRRRPDEICATSR